MNIRRFTAFTLFTLLAASCATIKKRLSFDELGALNYPLHHAVKTDITDNVLNVVLVFRLADARVDECRQRVEAQYVVNCVSTYVNDFSFRAPLDLTVAECVSKGFNDCLYDLANQFDGDGKTPLHYAVGKNRPSDVNMKIVETLLAIGANPYLSREKQVSKTVMGLLQEKLADARRRAQMRNCGHVIKCRKATDYVGRVFDWRKVADRWKALINEMPPLENFPEGNGVAIVPNR